jgi:carboxyl-terminal processing protease
MKKIMFFSWLLIGFLPIVSHAQKNDNSNALLLHTIASNIKQYHYSQRSFDDSFAEKTFQVYLNWLDPDQVIFQEKDIADLKQAGLKIDDELNGAEPKFYLQTAAVFRKRVAESQAICKTIFNQPFQFEKPETWNIKPPVASYPKNAVEQKNKWARLLKWQAIDRLQKISLAEMGKQKTALNVRNILQQNMKQKFESYATYTDSLLFGYYLKAILAAVDPHSVYFNTEEYQNFLGTKRSEKAVMCGLGMRLKQEGGYMKVETVLEGGVAEKSGQITAGDILVSVGQENGEKQNVAGHTSNEVAGMVVGPKGTSVTLSLKSSAVNTTRTVTLKRAPLVQTPEWASSLLIDKGNKKIGYLRLPRFYGDGGPRYAGADVVKELKKLKDEGAEAIVFDLRDNSGGSFQEVQQVIGAFITNGPTVQTKNANGSVEVMPDLDDKIYYDGPLVVMINAGTASASELYTSAMQDYKRALLIGSPSYGKGTVQGNLAVEQRFTNYVTGETATNNLGGGLWLTQKKFYRISGKSVQLKGITPDIALSNYLEYTDNTRERDQSGPLPYDEIKPADYKNWDRNDVAQPKQKIQGWIDQSSVFGKLKQNEMLLNKMFQAPVSLEWGKFVATQQKMDDLLSECRTLSLLKTKLSVNILGFDESLFNNDPAMRNRQNLLKSSIETDVMIDLATDAALELVKQQVNK